MTPHRQITEEVRFAMHALWMQGFNAAVMQAGWRLDATAKGELVINAISPKQRACHG